MILLGGFRLGLNLSYCLFNFFFKFLSFHRMFVLAGAEYRVEDLSISVKFVKLYMVLESLAFSFRFISFDDMIDELDFEG